MKPRSFEDYISAEQEQELAPILEAIAAKEGIVHISTEKGLKDYEGGDKMNEPSKDAMAVAEEICRVADVYTADQDPMEMTIQERIAIIIDRCIKASWGTCTCTYLINSTCPIHWPDSARAFTKEIENENAKTKKE